MNEFKINDLQFKYPDNLKMQRKDNIANSFTTLSGRTVGDIRGWYYADNTLSWPYLTTDEINKLLSATNNEFKITFDDIDGTQHTVNAIRTTIKYDKMFRFINGNPCFTKIEMGVKYPDVYTG